MCCMELRTCYFIGMNWPPYWTHEVLVPAIWDFFTSTRPPKCGACFAYVSDSIKNKRKCAHGHQGAAEQQRPFNLSLSSTFIPFSISPIWKHCAAVQPHCLNGHTALTVVCNRRPRGHLIPEHLLSCMTVTSSSCWVSVGHQPSQMYIYGFL